MEYFEVLQLFNDEIYPVRISVRKSLIKVAIYEIYVMKWGWWFWGTMSPWAPPRDVCEEHKTNSSASKILFIRYECLIRLFTLVYPIQKKELSGLIATFASK